MSKKITCDFVKSSFESEGYTLLSKEYKNSQTKLDYICPHGHSHSVTWANWRNGKRCPFCAGNAKLTIEYVREQFEKEGYVLLSKEYINSSTKLDYICPNKHKHSISWNNWQRGRRCPYCSNKIKLSFDFVKKSFESEGYTLLSTEYVNCSSKLKYKCPLGHVHNITWNDWRSGCRCRTCSYTDRAGPEHWNWKDGISDQGYCPLWKDKRYKEGIRDRDGNICLNPYCYKTTDLLTVHHIDYDKNNCHPSNLITVCRSCNVRANTNRTWHKAWYQAIMHRRYNYKY